MYTKAWILNENRCRRFQKRLIHRQRRMGLIRAGKHVVSDICLVWRKTSGNVLTGQRCECQLMSFTHALKYRQCGKLLWHMYLITRAERRAKEVAQRVEASVKSDNTRGEPWNSQGERWWEPTSVPESCPLTATYTVAHACPHTYVYTQ